MVGTSMKMKVILENNGKTQKWLAEQWGISQPSMSQKFKDNNWKESDIKKFCNIMNISYDIIFRLEDGKTI